MGDQDGSTRQVALNELVKLRHWADAMKTIEIRLPSGFSDAKGDVYEEYEEPVTRRPDPLSMKSVSRTIPPDSLQEMERRLRKRLGMQRHNQQAMLSQLRLLRWMVIAQTIVLCGLVVWR